jgi:hypothetical protein
MDTANSATWRKSTYSGGSGSECVEAGVAGHGHVLVRDTNDRGRGPVLRLPPARSPTSPPASAKTQPCNKRLPPRPIPTEGFTLARVRGKQRTQRTSARHQFPGARRPFRKRRQ